MTQNGHPPKGKPSPHEGWQNVVFWGEVFAFVAFLLWLVWG